jgi:uncharacterized protein DUF4440
MREIEEQLLRLKSEALEATKRRDGEFYDRYLSEDAVAITPYGVFDRQAIIAQMSSPASTFASTGTDDVRAFVLSDSSGVVTYRAHYPSGDVMVTTAYRLERDGWRGVVYQQTSVPAVDLPIAQEPSRP